MKINEETKNWRKVQGNSDAWFHDDVQERTDAVLRASVDDPHLPLELRSWRASTAFQRVLGHVPKGVVDEQGGLTLLSKSRLSTSNVPWRRFYFPCVMLPSSTPSLNTDVVPVPFQMCLVAYNWMTYSNYSSEDICDWRSTKYRWVIKLQPALRDLFTTKRRKLDDKRFGLKYMASDHSLGPIEAALMRWIYENKGPRLIIPPSFRDPRWALKENKKDRVDPYLYLYPEIDKEVEEWAQKSLWNGLITPKEKLLLKKV